MTWRSALWLAFRGGRSDRLRIVLTAASTALAAVFVLLAGAVVAPPDPVRRAPYANVELWTDPGLTGGIVVALGLLCLPAIALAGQCSRIGAPARERRMADLARIGAGARDLRRLVAVEGGVAAAGGVALGVACYALLALVVAAAGAPVPVTVPRGRPSETVWAADSFFLPTDRFPSLSLAVPGLLLLPLLVTLVGGIGQRRSRRPRRPSGGDVLGPLVVVLGSSAVLVMVSRVYLEGAPSGLDGRVVGVQVVAIVALVVGLSLLVGAMTSRAGRLLAGVAHRPALLLAARRLAGGHRRGAPRVTLLLGSAIGGAALVVRASFLSSTSAGYDPGDFYGQTFSLVLLGIGVATAVSALGLVVGEVDGVVERRRSLASAVAAGVPRSVLARAVVLEASAPVVPAVAVAAVLGAGVTHRLVVRISEDPYILPWAELGVLCLGICAAAVLAAGLATLALPASTDISEARVPA